nr:hypothetical protein [Saprospiraceae bacterium]
NGLKELKPTTSSDLIVLPNWPRFVMQGDWWRFPDRLINNTDSTLEGMLSITVKNAMSGEELTAAVVEESQVPFSIGANGSEIRFFHWNIPSDQIGLLSVEVFGSTPAASDGEKRLLPLLSSQVWITESFPVFLKGGESLDKTFALKQGVRPALNKTSFEYTSDPLWLAFQTLPFSSGDEAKNALQYFQIYYINAMALHMLNENPALRPTIKKWLKTDGLRGELMKNEEFKDLDLENTPWLRDALAQKVSREKLAVLLNENQAKMEMDRAVRGLIKHQRSDGAFSWFPGGPASWFITQELLTGYARLHHSAGSPADPGISDVIRKALAYSQEEAIHHFNKYYSGRIKDPRDSSRTISTPLVQFLYLKSLLEPWATEFGEWEGIYALAERDWMKLAPRTQSMLGVVFQIQGNTALAKTVAESLYERTRYENELGRYMPSGHSYHWERLPIGTQTALIELWSRMEEMKEAVAETQQWLLNHRRTNNWGAHATTSRAIESLMFHRKIPDEYSRPDKIRVNQRALPSSGVTPEAGTAYFKESLSLLKGEVSVQIENSGEDMSWGALYHQYFQEIDKVEIDKSTGLPLSIERVWMVEKSTDRGPVLVELKGGESLEVGQTLVGRIILKSDRSIQYVHLSDLRPSTLEPGNQMSGYRYRDGLVYYFSSGDSSTDFFLETLPKGTFVLEYKTTVTYAGEFNAGLIKAQSYFAPEFVTYGKGGGLKVKSQ